MSELVTVIIPAYNAESTLDEPLNSVGNVISPIELPQ